MSKMTLSERDLATINETLITDFDGQISLSTVIRILHDCAVTNPGASPRMVEQVARTKLQIHRRGLS
jgi:hypothetical protein